MRTNLKLKLQTIFKENFNENLFCIHSIGVPIVSINGISHKYIIYVIELHHHHIVEYRLLNKQPNTNDVIELLNFVSKAVPIRNVLFMKGSPFTKSSVINIMVKNNVNYYHFSRNEFPEILSISAAYLTRMLQFHILFNSKIYDEYIKDLILFWANRVVPITGLLPELNLIDGSVHVKMEVPNIYEQSHQRIDSLNNYSKTNVSLLSNYKFYNSKRYPVSLLILINLKTHMLDKLSVINGSIQEKDIFYFLEELLRSSSENYNFLIPNDDKFNSDLMKDFYKENNINTIEMDEDDPSFMDKFKELKVSAQIINNYYKDYLTKVSSQEDSENLIKSLEIHWNTSVYTIIPDMVKLATKNYK